MERDGALERDPELMDRDPELMDRDPELMDRLGALNVDREGADMLGRWIRGAGGVETDCRGEGAVIRDARDGAGALRGMLTLGA